MNRSHRRPAGFTLMEFLVVLAILAIVAGLGVPFIQNVVYRTQVRSSIRDISNLVQLARLESIRRGAPAVVEIFADDGGMRAFLDLHGEEQTDPPNGELNEIDGAEPRTTDWEIRRITLAAGLTFTDPDGVTGEDSIDGFLNTPAFPDKLLIFLSNGAAQSSGAFRFADQRLNYFEVRIEPAATGKAQVRKWNGTAFYPEGEKDRAWNWN